MPRDGAVLMQPPPTAVDDLTHTVPGDVPHNVPRHPPPSPPVPFESADAAIIWFARVQAGGELGAIPRACPPLAVLRSIDRLWRQRVLLRDHLLVLAHYGRRGAPPLAAVRREMRAALLWDEAMNALSPALRALGLVA